MENNVDIDKIRNEVLRKLGRNLLIFQNIEFLLKFFCANSSFTTYLNGCVSTLASQQERVRKCMMGQLINPFLTAVYGSEGGMEEIDFGELKVSFSFTLREGCDPEESNRRRVALGLVIKERNDLVHHFFSRIRQSSLESWLEADAYLERQREVVLPELNFLNDLAKTFDTVVDMHRAFLESDVGQELIFGKMDV